MTGGLARWNRRPASSGWMRACRDRSRLQVPGRPRPAPGGRGGADLRAWLGAFPSGPQAKSVRMVRAGGRSRETRGKMRFQGISQEPGAPAAPSPWGVLERRS